MKANISGVYVITDQNLTSSQQLFDKVSQTLQGGASILQYRDKSDNYDKRLQQAQQLAILCKHYQIPFIINDDIQLAKDIAAKGVHLGQQDLPLSSARNILGADAIIGITCHNQLSLAIKAQQDGANYVAFGSFYPSLNKPQAIRADISLLTKAKTYLDIPIVAIGGIDTPQKANDLYQAGADSIAVISGIFSHPTCQSITEQYARIFKTPYLK